MISESTIRALCAQWHALQDELAKAQARGWTFDIPSIEAKLSRIEDKLNRDDIDPNDYKPK